MISTDNILCPWKQGNVSIKKRQQLPIDQSTIDGVNEMAELEKQPILPGKYPLFEWAPGLVVDTYDYEKNLEDNYDNQQNNHLALPYIDNDERNIVSDNYDSCANEYSVNVALEDNNVMMAQEEDEIEERNQHVPFSDAPISESSDTDDLSSVCSEEHSFNMDHADVEQTNDEEE